MIITLVVLIILISVIAFIIYKINKTDVIFDIEKSLDLTELPVVTFKYNDTKLNFMLDTGSNDSFIAGKFAHLVGEATKIYKSKVAGFNGITEVEQKAYNVTLTTKKYSFDVELLEATHLNNAFDYIKSKHGVQIHGILGTNFFNKYKYILDFDKLIVCKR